MITSRTQQILPCTQATTVALYLKSDTNEIMGLEIRSAR